VKYSGKAARFSVMRVNGALAGAGRKRIHPAGASPAFDPIKDPACGPQSTSLFVKDAPRAVVEITQCRRRRNVPNGACFA